MAKSKTKRYASSKAKKKSHAPSKAKKKRVKALSKRSATFTAEALPNRKITRQQAQQIVFGVIQRNFPNAHLSPDQKLAMYGYTDGPKLIGLRDDIYDASGIYINSKDMIKCTKISDVINLLSPTGAAASIEGNI